MEAALLGGLKSITSELLTSTGLVLTTFSSTSSISCSVVGGGVKQVRFLRLGQVMGVLSTLPARVPPIPVGVAGQRHFGEVAILDVVGVRGNKSVLLVVVLLTLVVLPIFSKPSEADMDGELYRDGFLTVELFTVSVSSTACWECVTDITEVSSRLSWSAHSTSFSPSVSLTRESYRSCIMGVTQLVAFSSWYCLYDSSRDSDSNLQLMI